MAIVVLVLYGLAVAAAAGGRADEPIELINNLS